MIERIEEELYSWWENVLEHSPSIIIGLFFLILLTFLGWIFKRFFLKRFASRFSDGLLTRFIGNIIFTIFVIFGTIVFLNQIGLAKAATGMMAGAGVTAIVLGFAFRDLGENLLSGIMMAFSRPFNVGDVIEIEGFVGTVQFLNLRNTHIRTFNGRDIYVPNSTMIKNPLINYTKDGLLRHDFIVGIDYNEPIQEVMETILNTLEKQAHIVQSEALKPFVAIDQFATSTINLKIHFWINSKDYVGSTVLLKTEVMRNILNAIIEKGYGMPADILELKIFQENQPIPISVRQHLNAQDRPSSGRGNQK
jgi:small-conductance mechanosensitive channel